MFGSGYCMLLCYKGWCIWSWLCFGMSLLLLKAQMLRKRETRWRFHKFFDVHLSNWEDMIQFDVFISIGYQSIDPNFQRDIQQDIQQTNTNHQVFQWFMSSGGLFVGLILGVWHLKGRRSFWWICVSLIGFNKELKKGMDGGWTFWNQSHQVEKTKNPYIYIYLYINTYIYIDTYLWCNKKGKDQEASFWSWWKADSQARWLPSIRTSIAWTSSIHEPTMERLVYVSKWLVPTSSKILGPLVFFFVFFLRICW